MTATIETPSATPDERELYLRRKRYRLRYEQGERVMIDATRAREHLQRLAEQGTGRRTVTQALGISDLTLVQIRSGRRRSIRRDTEDLILAFQPAQADLVENCARVDATATRLRVEALIALGYTRGYIAQRLGRAQGELDLRERVYRRRALAILELCREIGDTPGPSRKAAVQARNKGWRVPAEFDEDDFYDPHWDGSEPDAPAGGRPAQILDEYDFLAPCGLDAEQIAARLGISAGYLQLLIRQRREERAIEAEACRTEHLAVR